MPLAPVLLDLEETIGHLLSQKTIDDDVLMSKFAQARNFLLESVGLFREVEETLNADPETSQKLTLCDQEMKHSLTALDKLQHAAMGRKLLILKERLQSFLGSRRICLEYFADFSRLAARQPIYSPVPTYDAFVKAGAKVLDGQLDKQRLQERFPSLMPELHKVQRLVGLLPRLHQPPAELIQALEQGLQGLQTGYGALANYFETNDVVALEDGLKLIGSSSTVLASQLHKAEQLCAANPKYSKFRPLEEWMRLKSYLSNNPDDSIPELWIGLSIAQIFFLWDFLIGQGRSLLENPLLADADVVFSLNPELISESFKLRNQANESLATLQGDALLNSSDADWLAYSPKIEELQAAVEQALKAVENEMIPFRELPGLELIVSLKEDVKKGLQDKSLLRTEFQKQLDKVEELIDSVRGQKDPISREFADLLPIHRSAFMGMLENLEDDDWYSLDSRWQGILSTLPRLANLSRAIRHRLQSQSSSSKLVRCLRCEANNEPTRRVCSTCGANLPAIVQKMQTFSEIDTSTSGGESVPTAPSVSPRAIDLLEALVRNVESNRVSKKDAESAIQLLIDDVSQQRQMFGKKLLPLMGKDEALDSYLRYFAEGIGQYFTNLVAMQSAIAQGSLPQLHSGFSETRDTLETLDAMKERIDEALRG